MKTNKLFDEAVEQYNKGNYDACLNLLTSLMPIYLQTETWENYAQALYYTLECKYQKAEYGSAIVLWQQILPVLQNNLSIGAIFWVELHSVAGNIYGMLANYSEQIKCYQKALILASDKEKPSLYANIGWLYLKSKDYVKALDYLEMAYALFKQQNNQYEIVYVITQIAASLRHLDKLPQALTYYLEGKAIIEREKWIEDKQHKDIVAQLYQNIAKCYFELKDYELALAHYQTAQKYYEQMPQKSKNALYHNLGDLYHIQKQWNEAANYYTQALHESRRVYGEKHATTAHQYRALAAFYAQQNQYEQALSFYQKAICCVCSSFCNLSAKTNPIIIDVLWHYRLLEAVAGKASVFEQISNEQKEATNHIDNLQYALDAWLLADQLIDYLRRNFEAEASKLNFAQFAAKVYAQALNTAMALHKKQHKTALLYAFMFSEKTKAMVLLEKMENAKAKVTAQIPQKLLAEEQLLLQQITELNRKVQQQPNELSLRNAYFEAQQQHEQVLKQFKNDYPQYYQLQHEVQTVTVAQLQLLLQGTQTAIVEYCLTDTELHTWVITSNAHCVVSQLKPKLQHWIKQWQKAVKTMNLKEYITTSTELYDCLIKPIEPYLNNSNELIVIPQAELLYLPFQALLSKQLPNKPTYKNLPYLLLQYAIGYHYSASLLYSQNLIIAKSKTDNDSGSFWGLAPVQYGNADGLKDLPDAQLEVEEVAALFDARNKNACLALYNEASLANFMHQAKQYQYLLLSTHACYNSEAAEQTRILFSPYSNAYANTISVRQSDYCLFVEDTYNLQLQADLIVLSACESGLGTLISGEGMMGINRGFMYAGASNIVFTLERVPARYARLLIVELFKQILIGKNYRQALQIAQANLANIGQPPINWAFFCLIGKL